MIAAGAPVGRAATERLLDDVAAPAGFQERARHVVDPQAGAGRGGPGAGRHARVLADRGDPEVGIAAGPRAEPIEADPIRLASAIGQAGAASAWLTSLFIHPITVPEAVPANVQFIGATRLPAPCAVPSFGLAHAPPGVELPVAAPLFTETDPLA